MNCNKCPLNAKSCHFNLALIKRVPSSLRKLFQCTQNPSQIDNATRKTLCSLDLWVLTFIGANDKTAVKFAGQTLDLLVAIGNSELLCNLFECSNYETRRKLWLRMVNKHSKRLYLFDTMFEKDELAPIEPGIIPEDFHHYQYHMLMGNCQESTVKECLQ